MATHEPIQALLGFHAAAGGHIGRPIWPMKPRTSAAGVPSEPAAQDFNLFGTKRHVHPIYETVSIPTRKFKNEQGIVLDSPWGQYPTPVACYADLYQNSSLE